MTRALWFLLSEREPAREEKRRFYLSQIRLLADDGVEARLGSIESLDTAEVGERSILTFDVALYNEVMRIGLAGVSFVPLIWNRFRLLRGQREWIRKNPLVQRVLAPDEAALNALQLFNLGKPLDVIQTGLDFCDTPIVAPPRLGEPLRAIGYFAEQNMRSIFVLSSLLRQDQLFGQLELVELEFEKPTAWYRDLRNVDAVLAVRELSGPALSLLEAMASGLMVVGSHGGGLTGVADETNGVWIDSATLDDFVSGLRSAIDRSEKDRSWRQVLAAAARDAALAQNADAGFALNKRVWSDLLGPTRSGNQEL